MPEQTALDDLLKGLVGGQARLAARLTELELLPLAPAPGAGTWTPFFAGSTTAGVFTYATQQGYYIAHNGKVDIFGTVAISAIGTPPGGTMRIGGLPFASAATYLSGVSFASISNFNYTAAALQLTGSIVGGVDFIALRESFDNALNVQVPAANFLNAACGLAFSGTYPLP